MSKQRIKQLQEIAKKYKCDAAEDGCPHCEDFDNLIEDIVSFDCNWASRQEIDDILREELDEHLISSKHRWQIAQRLLNIRGGENGPQKKNR